MSDVVVVESPAKAKTINRYLGGGYTVLASLGHVRDLPPKDGSVRPEQDFAMDWQSDARGEKQVGAIAKALKGAGTLYLATDPDREGEAISWHVKAMLADKKALKGIKVRRITFNEITRSAVRDAMAAPARPRPAADRGLPGAPRAGLPGRLHPLAGAVAQAARQPQRRPRAVGRAAADLRARGRDRGVPRPRILDGRGRLHHARRRAVHRAADASRRQEARPVRPPQRSRLAMRAKAARRGGPLHRRLGREEARQAQPARAVHHLDAAAGGIAQARLRRAADHAAGAAALRRRRDRRRDRRPDHLHAHRRRADGARGGRRDPRPRAGELRRATTCRRRRASTRPRSRTRRRRTRRSARPTSRARPTASRASSQRTSAGSTS